MARVLVTKTEEATAGADMNHQVMCQISGRKEWIFIDPLTSIDAVPMWSGHYARPCREKNSSQIGGRTPYRCAESGDGKCQVRAAC